LISHKTGAEIADEKGGGGKKQKYRLTSAQGGQMVSYISILPNGI
jgi:hypothetical protein